MKSSRSFIAVFFVLVAIWIGLQRYHSHVWSFPAHGGETSKKKAISESTNNVASGRGKAGLTGTNRANLTKIVDAFTAPIIFYGRVIDQNGDSVPVAKVFYSAADRYFGDSSKYHGVSDEAGFFSISGI